MWNGKALADFMCYYGNTKVPSQLYACDRASAGTGRGAKVKKNRNGGLEMMAQRLPGDVWMANIHSSQLEWISCVVPHGDGVVRGRLAYVRVSGFSNARQSNHNLCWCHKPRGA
jgi:hypothetical protein